MAQDIIVFKNENIKSNIHTIRGKQVIIDRDLAELYEVETKALNQAVKRNSERFPENFMFQLTKEEEKSLRSQNVTINNSEMMWSQNVTTSNKRGKHRKYLIYAFTEQGVAMLSGVLRSKKAVKVSIQIIEAFIAMRKFISKNAEIFLRLDNVERKQLQFQIKTDKNFEKVFNAIESKDIKPEQGIFFNGQIFDAYKFVSDLIRNAKKSIILIDNYIDESVLTFFSKRKENVKVIIYTKDITKRLKLDIKKFNSQYNSISVKEFKHSHDRFMIIDNKEVYHFGASLKDLGKKWFAFSKFDKSALNILNRLDNPALTL